MSASEKTRVTSVEISRALGIGKRAVECRAISNAWSFEEESVIGGKKRFYPLADLPAEIVNALHVHAMSTQAVADGPIAPVPAQSTSAALTPIDPHSLTTHQLDVERARDRIFLFIDGYQGSTKAALAYLNDEKTAGRLAGPMLWAYEHAWDKPRASNRLSAKTYYNWVAEKKERGRAAPKKVQKDMSVKPWYPLAIALKQRPQGSTMAWIAEQIAAQWNPAWGDKTPTEYAVRYFLKEKFSALDQLKGRHTGSALRAHMHFTKRTSDGMLPWDELHADGWNTHFTAPHPETGEFVTYEVWHAHDVATRVVPPFGLGLTENFEVISKCIENAVRFGGVMAILMTDSTGVVKKSERLKTNPATSLADRAGFTIVHPQEVGNSQANGIAENFNKYLDRCSRELATYQSKDMDSLTLKRVKRLTGKMVAAATKGDVAERAQLKAEAERMGKGKVFDSHAEAIAWLDDIREKFNNKPHSSLPKIRDPETGKLRHQTPYEALAAHRAAGWQGVMLDELHLIDMFWQHVQKKVYRETVSPYGKMVFYDPALGAWNGKDVVVAFDEGNYEHVWVKTLAGEIICEAKRSRATPYRVQTAREAADEKRALGQIARREKQIENIRSRTPGMTIENEGALMDAPRLKTIADFIDVESTSVVEPQRTILDFLPDPETERPATMDRDEVVRWLYSKSEDNGDSDEEKGVADKREAAG